MPDGINFTATDSVAITFFPDQFAQRKQEERRTLADLADLIRDKTAEHKTKLPWLKLARFGDNPTAKGSLRHDGNVTAITGIEVDYDAGQMTFQEALERVEKGGLTSIIYTSPSHTEDAPRWRVLCPTSTELNPNKRAHLVGRLNGLLGGVVAPESFAISQSYYFGSVRRNPSHCVAVTDGQHIDLADELDEVWIGKTAAKPDFGFTFDAGGSGGDRSRSGKAMRCAARVKGAGGTYEQFVEALDKNPDTAAWKAEKGLPNGGREMRRTWDNCRAKPRDGDSDGDGGDMELTEDGVALAFTEKFHDALRYCHDTGAWYVWEGSHWRQNRDKIAFSWARQLVRKLNRSAEFKTKAITGKASFAASVERFAQADRAFAVTTEKWDRARDLLGTPGGTVDLRTGIMRPAAREDHITKTTAITPAETADCPTWLAFLAQATAKDAGLIRFLQQWCGYCLSGSTREHALLFIYGPGGNGKSVFLNTLAGILADYVASAAMDTFTSSPGDKHPTDLAMLRGARLVTATETEEGRAWAEARIKQMTGGDPVTARFMRQDFFTYTPQFKLTIAGNHKPALRNVDDAARRRFNIVPFLHKPETPDRHLEHKLKAEWPGILRWMIEGCLDWQEHGLVRPAIVVDATAEYFEAQDAFSQWLKECCIIGPPASAKPGELLASFTGWCQRNGEMTPNRNKMRGMLERVPTLKYVTNGGTQWVRNIKLLPSGQQGGADHE